MNALLAELATTVRRQQVVRTAGRVLLWAAVVLVVGRGLVSLVAGPAGAAAPKPASPAAGSPNGPAVFPGPDAQALALRFAADYLTYDEANPGDYQTRLAAYGYGPALAAGWDGKGHQTVSTVVPAASSADSAGAATITVAARTGTRWLYLAVPVTATPTGPAIAARPAFVAAPATGTIPAAATAGKDPVDPGAAEALRPTVEAFLAAWATGSQPVISALSADGARLARPEPGSATLAGLDTVAVATAPPEAAERTAVVTVRWADPTSGATLTQPYRMSLVRVGERWLVRSLGPDLPTPQPASVRSTKKEK
jgi:hypothetical protein